jgi:ATP-dependent Clp protease ATP-binding subunit ClpB
MTQAIHGTADRLLALAGLRAGLHASIRGQSSALDAIAAAAVRAVLGLVEVAPRFLLLGPTGVGKTQTALTLSQAVFRREAWRLDMSEYQRQESLDNLLGTLQGEPGRLGRMTAESASGLLLMDELEKAHPLVLDLLLQMLEPGHVTLASGQRLDLRDCFIVCTSNIATADLVDLQHASPATIERHVRAQAEQVLRAEIVNRFDDVLVFAPLDYDTQVEIARLHLDALLQFLARQGYRVTADEAVVQFLVGQGFDRRMGARPLRRALQRWVGDAVAADLLAGGTGRGTLRVRADEPGLELVDTSQPPQPSRIA